MALIITNTLITSDLTHHAAVNSDAGWTISWWNPEKLGHRDFDVHSATTAMRLAEEVAKGRDAKDSSNFSYRRWLLISEWTRELGLLGLQAVALLEEWPTGKSKEES